MRKAIFVPMGIIFCLSSAYAVNWDKTLNHTKQQNFEIKQRAKLITKIDILMSEAIAVANDAIKSLEKNLNVLTQIEMDKEFRNCAIKKDNLQKMKILGESAKELFDEREITKNQYNNYIKKIKIETKALNQIINIQCNTKG